MIEQNRFFLWIYRLCALFGLVAFVGIAFVVLHGVVFVPQSRMPGTIAVSDPARPDAPALRLRTGEIKDIAGTGQRVLPLFVVPGSVGRGSLRFSDYDRSARTRDLLFIVRGQPQARRLFGKAGMPIAEWRPLCRCQDGKTESNAVAVYLEVVKRDTDGDGDRGDGDRVVPALVRVDGTGYTELGGDVDRIIEATLSADDKVLELLVENDQSLWYREYGIDDFALRSEQAIARLGD